MAAAHAAKIARYAARTTTPFLPTVVSPMMRPVNCEPMRLSWISVSPTLAGLPTTRERGGTCISAGTSFSSMNIITGRLTVEARTERLQALTVRLDRLGLAAAIVAIRLLPVGEWLTSFQAWRPSGTRPMPARAGGWRRWV